MTRGGAEALAIVPLQNRGKHRQQTCRLGSIDEPGTGGCSEPQVNRESLHPCFGFYAGARAIIHAGSKWRPTSFVPLPPMRNAVARMSFAALRSANESITAVGAGWRMVQHDPETFHHFRHKHGGQVAIAGQKNQVITVILEPGSFDVLDHAVRRLQHDHICLSKHTIRLARLALREQYTCASSTQSRPTISIEPGPAFRDLPVTPKWLADKTTTLFRAVLRKC